MTDLKEIKSGIIICPNSLKFQILEKNITLKKMKFYDLESIINELTFWFEEEAYVYLSTKMNISPSNTKLYEGYLRYIDRYINKKEEKYQFLINLYDNLKSLNFIKDGYYKNKNINEHVTIIGYEESSLLNLLLEILNNKHVDYEYIPNNFTDQKCIMDNIYHFETISDESKWIFSNIDDLLYNKHIDPINIKIANYNDEYYFDFYSLANFYNISINFPSEQNILSTNTVRDLFNKIDKLSSVYEIENIIKDSPFNNKIVNIINKANLRKYKPSEVKEYLRYKLKHLSFEKVNKENSIEIIDLYNYVPSDEDYIFIISMNSDTTPLVVSELGYFTKKERTELKLENYEELNKYNRLKLISFINNTKNKYVSYKDRSDFGVYFISSVIAELENCKIISPEHNWGKNEKDDIQTLGIAYDKYLKFKEKGKNNYNFENHNFNIRYKDFDGSFKGIDPEKMKKFYPLKLSPTHLNDYYNCPFKYYLLRIMGLDIFEDRINMNEGTIIHSIYEKVYKDKIYDKEKIKSVANNIVNDFYSNQNNPREEFFVRLMVDKIIDPLYIDINNEFPGVEWKLENNIGVWFDKNYYLHGYIDKYYYKIFDGKKEVIVIDYKTGHIPNYCNFLYGIDGQIIIYGYLLTHDSDNKNNNIKYIGSFLQQTPKEKEEKLEYEGFYLNNTHINEIIPSIRFNSKCNIDEKSLKLFDDLVEKNVLKAFKNIDNANFQISPKIISSNSTCKYCKFSGICNKSFKYNKVKGTTSLNSFIEMLGENNGN